MKLKRLDLSYNRLTGDIPEEAPDESEFRAGANTPAAISREGNRIGTEQRTINPAAGINCPDIKPHYAHMPTTTSGKIIGKGSGSCYYVYGPPQTLTYDAYVYL